MVKKEILPGSQTRSCSKLFYMLYGKVPQESHVEALEMYIMLSADHDMNASTFTAMSGYFDQADIVSAIIRPSAPYWAFTWRCTHRKLMTCWI